MDEEQRADTTPNEEEQEADIISSKLDSRKSQGNTKILGGQRSARIYHKK